MSRVRTSCPAPKIPAADETPLHHAADLGNAELVQTLLEAGARVDARCADRWTPLMRACNAGTPAVAKLLVAAGADLEAKNNEGYTTYGRVHGDAPELLAFMKAKGGR